MTKEQLIDFINKNFYELKAGGCADYSQDYQGMELADINASERAIINLITKKHKVTFDPNK